MSQADPYRDIKPYHMAKLFGPKGQVSPLCAAKPRALNLKVATWTFRWEAVTCKRCLAMKPGDDRPAGLVGDDGGIREGRGS